MGDSLRVRLADAITDWLQSPVGLIHGILVVVLWPAPFALVIILGHLGIYKIVALAMLALMDVLTIGSWITQFPLAYASRRGEVHALNTMRLLVAGQEEARLAQLEQGERLARIEAALPSPQTLG